MRHFLFALAALFGMQALVPAQAADIRVLVVSTPAAKAKQSSDYIARMIENANRALLASNVNHELVLAASRTLTSYVDTNMETDLTRARNMNDGKLENIHTLRNTFAADVVLMIADYSPGQPNTGISWVPGPTNAADAFLLCDVDRCNASDEFVFGHEMGHIYGCEHQDVPVSVRAYQLPGTNIVTLGGNVSPPLTVTRLFYSANGVSLPAYGPIGDASHDCATLIRVRGNVISLFR